MLVESEVEKETTVILEFPSTHLAPVKFDKFAQTYESPPFQVASLVYFYTLFGFACVNELRQALNNLDVLDLNKANLLHFCL